MSKTRFGHCAMWCGIITVFSCLMPLLTFYGSIGGLMALVSRSHFLLLIWTEVGNADHILMTLLAAFATLTLLVAIAVIVFGAILIRKGRFRKTTIALYTIMSFLCIACIAVGFLYAHGEFGHAPFTSGRYRLNDATTSIGLWFMFIPPVVGIVLALWNFAKVRWPRSESQPEHHAP